MQEMMDRVEYFNHMYALPVQKRLPQLQQGFLERMVAFKKILTDEVSEIDDIIATARVKLTTGEYHNKDLQILTMLADWLGDIVVYVMSEAHRNGIPLEAVMNIIMDSNASKLGEDGNPIYHPETGKVMKGPNYWKPEPNIEVLLSDYQATGK